MIVEILKINDKAIIPNYATNGSAGLDISACIEEDIILKPKEVKLISTGLSFAIPEGYECQVRSRSGLALKHGIFCLNSPGTIDSDYRGEVKIILANFSDEPFIISNGMRLAQLVFAKYEKVEIKIVEQLNETNRNSGGFGSTGL